LASNGREIIVYDLRIRFPGEPEDDLSETCSPSGYAQRSDPKNADSDA
jgi:hypothetical protein